MIYQIIYNYRTEIYQLFIQLVNINLYSKLSKIGYKKKKMYCLVKIISKIQKSFRIFHIPNEKIFFGRLFKVFLCLPTFHSLADTGNACNLTMFIGVEEKYGVLKAMIHRVKCRYPARRGRGGPIAVVSFCAHSLRFCSSKSCTPLNRI